MKKYTFEIDYDEDVRFHDSPREWDNLGTIITAPLSHYTLGDIAGDPEEIKKEISRIKKRGGVALPVYKYEHGSIALSTSPFSCPWDSGQIGYIYADKQAIINEYGEITEETQEKTTKVLIDEIETYSNYLNGSIYMYIVKEDTGKVIEAVGGYFDRKNAKEDAKNLIKFLENKDRKEHREQLKKYIVNNVPLIHRWN